MVVVLPGIRAGGTEVFARGNRGSSFVLLLLDFRDLVGVLVRSGKMMSVVYGGAFCRCEYEVFEIKKFRKNRATQS